MLLYDADHDKWDKTARTRLEDMPDVSFFQIADTAGKVDAGGGI